MPAQFVLDTGQLDVDLLGPVVVATAEADLGNIGGAASTLVSITVQASSNLGSLDAEADTIPTPPYTPVTYGRNFVQPNFAQIAEKPIKKITVQGLTNLGDIKSNAQTVITFSIIEDDNEVLLLI